MATVLKKTVNEDRLLSLVHNFFSHPNSVMLELAQNASRSGAKTMEIVLQEDYLKVRDNGHGIEDPEPLFVLADSDWSQDVERDQMPAGWGLFYLYSLSEKVSMKSRFGRIEFDCERFFSDSDYRKNVLGLVDSEDRTDGFEAEVVLKPGISDKLAEEKENLGWFSMNILFNGEVVPRQGIDQYKKKDKDFIETTYQGNRVFIDPHCIALWRESLKASVIWYGIPIDLEKYSGRFYPRGVFLDVRCGSPLTPVLPYRQSIKKDEKFEEFHEFVRRTAVKHLLSRLKDEQDNPSRTVSILRALERFAFQKELDALDRFYVIQREPHHDPYYSYGSVENREKEVLVLRDPSPVLVSEKLVLEGLEEEDVLLPRDAVKSLTLPENHPSWLPGKITEKEVRIKVLEDKNAKVFSGIDLHWVKAKIEGIEGPKVLALDCSNPTVYYENLDDVFEDDFLDLVFENFMYNEDGDQFDTQRDDFFKYVREDFMTLTGKYDLHDLLSGLWLARISPSGVRSIEIDKEAGKMVIVTNRGEEKTLRI